MPGGGAAAAHTRALVHLVRTRNNNKYMYRREPEKISNYAAGGAKTARPPATRDRFVQRQYMYVVCSADEFLSRCTYIGMLFCTLSCTFFSPSSAS